MANIDEMVECTLAEPDDFLKIRETLTRIGVASRKDRTLFQSIANTVVTDGWFDYDQYISAPNSSSQWDG